MTKIRDKWYEDFGVMVIIIGFILQALIILTLGWNQPRFWRLWPPW